MKKPTDKPDYSSYEGVEVAAGGVDVGLRPDPVLPPGETAEQDPLSDHYLTKRDKRAAVSEIPPTRKG